MPAAFTSAKQLTCFLSHTRGVAVEETVRNVLTQLQVEVTTALDVPEGTSLAASVTQAVLSADFICVVLGPQSPSPAVMYEAGIAVGGRRPIVVVTSTDSDSAVTETIDAPIVRYRSSHDNSIRDGLNAYVKNIQPLAAELKVNWDTLTAARLPVRAGSRPTGSELQKTIAEWLEAAGAAVVSANANQKGVEADIVATFPSFGDAYSRVVVEVKNSNSTGPLGWQLDQLKRNMRIFDSRIGLFVSPGVSIGRFNIEDGTGILSVSVRELEIWARSGDLAPKLVRLRNQLVHS